MSIHFGKCEVDLYVHIVSSHGKGVVLETIDNEKPLYIELKRLNLI